MRSQIVEIRHMLEEDIEKVHAFGLSDFSFSVSNDVHFYEKEELLEWIHTPKQNILLIGTMDGGVVGFLYTHIISKLWGILDGLYVKPDLRGHGIGTKMYNTAYQELQSRGVEYISVQLDVNDSDSRGFILNKGFRTLKTYSWYGKDIEVHPK